MRKKLMAALLLALVLGTPIAFAATEFVKTIVSFDIGANEELTVTLLGTAAKVSAAGAGNTTANNIEWNLSAANSGSLIWSNATVGGGGSTQSASAILQIDNTGNRDLNVTINLSSALPTCIQMIVNTSMQGSITAAKAAESENLTDGVGWIIDASYTPAEAAIDLFLYANFTGCTYSDTGTRNLYLISIGV